MTDSCFFYLRLPDRTPVGVVALQTSDEPDVVYVAASLCHETDEWVRSTAVNKARGRLRSERCRCEAYGDDPLGYILDELRIDYGARGVDILHAQALFTKQFDYLTTEPDEHDHPDTT